MPKILMTKSLFRLGKKIFYLLPICQKKPIRANVVGMSSLEKKKHKICDNHNKSYCLAQALNLV